MKKLLIGMSLMSSILTGCGQTIDGNDGGTTGVTHTPTTNRANNNTSTPSNHTTPKQTGYDYKKLLGFQPMLSSKMPSGYTLKNIQTEIDKMSKEGKIYSFSALYQNGNSAFGVTELKATGNATIPTPNSTRKVTINGISGMSYNQDGYTLQFTKGGIIYRVHGDENADQDQQDVMRIASSLTVPAQKKPDQTIRHSFK